MVGKAVTSTDVAELAGVSRATVSLVLNNVKNVKLRPVTRQKVIDAANQLGYVPDAAAQSLVSRRSQIIGLVLTRDPHHISSDAFLTQVIDGLIDSVHSHKMRLIIDIIDIQHQKQAYLDLVKSKRIDGLLLSGPRFDDQALEALKDYGFPTVLIGQLPGSGFCSVDVDNCLSAKMAVSHLIELGHSKIGCITNAPASFTASIDRLEGYKDALEENGFQIDDSLVRFGNFDPESGYLQMGSLLDEHPELTSVFVASDVVAFGAGTAISERGLKIPDDISLVGFDDVPLARHFNPPLTTVDLPAYDLAREACDLLVKVIRGESSSNEFILLDTKLVIRNSTAPRGGRK